MEVELMIASIMDSFEEQNQQASPQDLVASCKTCRILIKNAVEKQQDQYQQVKLSNTKIQERVVNVPGALGLLQAAGFVQEGQVLVYTPEENTTEIATAIVAALELKVQELQNIMPSKAVPSQSEPSPFLSEEERRKRAAMAKEARRKKAAERALTRQRLEEDKKERAERLKREELVKKAAAKQDNDDIVASGVFIHRAAKQQHQLPTPMKEVKGPQVGSLVPSAVPMDTDEKLSLAKKRSFTESSSHSSDAEQQSDNMMMIDQKPAAKKQDASSSSDSTSEWKACLEHLPRCCAAEGIRESSIYRDKAKSLCGRPTCLKKLLHELSSLDECLPTEPAIWLRFDEETPQFLRALITAPADTPYSFGMFCFDIYIPDNYPQVPPKMQLLTTGGGSVRFGPNLYADGKVCLSLLGTWPGPKWSPLHSSIFQVLVSIQGLILGVEHPFYLEPGHGGWEGDVKEGEFQVEGKTLSGVTVKAEFGVPQEVVAYEEPLRLGTVEFAMLETLTGARHLVPFEKAITAHFYHHSNAIIAETQKWLASSSASAALLSSAKTSRLNKLIPKLEKQLSSLKPPILDDGVKKAPLPPSAKEDVVSTKKNPPNDATVAMDEDEPAQKADGVVSMIASKQSEMEDAARNGDYVRAGNLQTEIQHLEEVKPQLKDLERKIAQAADKQDFIRAGRLQEQYKALSNPDASASTANQNATNLAAMWDQGEDEFGPGGLGGPPPPFMGNLGAPVGLGSNVYAPPSHKFSTSAPKNHHWGSGHALHATPAKPTEAQKSATAKKAPIPPDRLCRLRIRLPDNRTILEDFDRNDHLSTVYRLLESLVPSEADDGSTLTPLNARSGAFSQPLSSAGFTLLLSHPKREFNKEMHGTQSLEELNLAPSATLTVMMCNARGIVHRGELDARLQEAQGMAMEVDGLSYEGLVELTERVGTAAPPDGAVSLTLTKQDLEQSSTMMSPCSLLATGVPEEEQKCPICLGEYSPEDESECLRKLNRCGHHFHDSCFLTWIRTKSSCPLCKASIA